jgi:DNA-binding transcriptional ArsR family regulator
MGKKKTQTIKIKFDKKALKIVDTLSNCGDFGDPKEYYRNLIKIRNQFNENEDKIELQKILGAIGNFERFLILDMLKQKDRCVCELEAILQKTQPAVSRQLKILEKNKLIRGWKSGKFTHYSLNQPTFTKFIEIWNQWNAKITNWFGTV